MQRDSDDSSTTAATGQSTPSDTTQPPTTQATTEPTVEAVVAMPDLVSKALSQTRPCCAAPGTTVETTETLDETAVDGTILTQTPAPGTQPIPAVVQVTVARQSVTSYLKDLEAIESSMSADSTEVDGQVFPHALIGSLYSDRSARHALGRDYRRFVATVGLADDSPDSNAKATFEVFADGRKIFDETVGYGATAEIDLDVTGVLRLQRQRHRRWRGCQRRVGGCSRSWPTGRGTCPDRPVDERGSPSAGWSGSRRTARPGQFLLLGRDESCDVTLGGPETSRRHARVSWQPDGWVLVDLSSASRTTVNGREIAQMVLGDGDVISRWAPTTRRSTWASPELRRHQHSPGAREPVRDHRTK